MLITVTTHISKYKKDDTIVVEVIKRNIELKKVKNHIHISLG